MINKIKGSKILSYIISFLYYAVYLTGAWSIADWVTENIGTSPTSSFYGLVAIIVLLGIFSIQNSIKSSSIISLEEDEENN